MNYFLDYLKDYNNWITIWIVVMVLVSSLLFLLKKSEQITLERVYLFTVFLYIIFDSFQSNYSEMLYNDSEGYIWLLRFIWALFILTGILIIPPTIFLGLIFLIICIFYCIFIFLKATILGVSIDDVEVIGMSNLYYEKKRKKERYDEFIKLIEKLIKLELKNSPNDFKKINDAYNNIKRNYYNNPSYYWDYIEKRANHLKSIEGIPDKEFLLEIKNKLYKLSNSTKQSTEFIEGINKLIKVINILEKKIKE